MDTYKNKYDKALERARKNYDTAQDLCSGSQIGVECFKNTLTNIFPELKESEDERIRKEIIDFVKSRGGFKGDWIAWLEKQGEVESDNDDIEVEEKGIREAFNKIEDEKQCKQKPQRMISAEAKEAMYNKPADKVEPKFNVGDWVVYYRNDSSREVLQVYDIRDSRYYFTDNVHFSWSVKECDKKSHLWTIQDAKDGDVLAFKNNIGGIIICKSPTDYDTRSYCRLVSDNLINKEESGWDSTLFVPAIKEQRDLLFLKMHEAGYEWDADKKELKKISQRMISAEAKEAMYAKTAWSEDDEKMLVDAYVMLDWYKGNNWWTARRIKDWLETLKQRIGG